MMKAIFRLFMVALLCLAYAGTASAAIRNSKHDFSATSNANSGSYSLTGEDRMCVFCHTPHNAVENIPLWNRTGGTGTYLLYTSSATLTSATKASVINADNISYKCLSCHDGTVSIGGGIQQFKPTDLTNAGQDKVIGNAAVGADGTGSLTNDHPIGFNYDQVLNGTNSDDKFQTLATVTGDGLKFYKADTKVNQMECATCHDVHGQSASGTKFLRTSNAKSALCLTCHIK